MKKDNYYESSKRVDGSTTLGKFFNIVLDKLDILRAVYYPHSYETLRISGHKTEEVKLISGNVFYDICLGELYFHSVIENLTRWQEVINEYIVDFNCKWKYYAVSKRMNSIGKYGCDKNDCSASEDELTLYSIINNLGSNDWQDMFLTARSVDLYPLALKLKVFGSIDVNDMFQKCFKVKIPSYRLENGEMIENSFADELIYRIEREDSAVLAANTLMTVCNEICRMINDVKRLDMKSDNKDFFNHLPYRIQDILDLNVEPKNFFDE